MQSGKSPKWIVRSSIPPDLNFVLWLHRKAAIPKEDPALSSWLQLIIAKRHASASVLADQTPNERLRNLCFQHWDNFMRHWQAGEIQALDARLAMAHKGAKLSELNLNREIRIMHTTEPGDWVQCFPDAWVVGDSYFEPEPLRDLVERIARIPPR